MIGNHPKTGNLEINSRWKRKNSSGIERFPGGKERILGRNKRFPGGKIALLGGNERFPPGKNALLHRIISLSVGKDEIRGSVQ
ncbi:MAG: hypothetical protein IPP77_13330 [Bacteroidetes bacterium]|nr:hypothetical protein [Bacteroidota bacterium]